MPIWRGKKPRGREIAAFEGISARRDTSTAAHLHEAIQQAAAKAAAAGATENDVFEVSQIQIVVGNPNVKVYRVVITPNP